MICSEYDSVPLYFVHRGYLWISAQGAIIYLNRIEQVSFVMVKCGVLFAVRTGFLNII
jgi:hypothetical protein